MNFLERDELVKKMEFAREQLEKSIKSIRRDGQHFRSVMQAKGTLLRAQSEVQAAHQMMLQWLRDNNPMLKVRR